MTKVAIKNENITSFGGIYHIMDVFSKLGFERQRWQATDRYLREDIQFFDVDLFCGKEKVEGFNKVITQKIGKVKNLGDARNKE